tara:strand:+ start:33 stop:413 length:381 start_codon:yes stop_codon:yes gene_type:complete
MMMNQHRGEIKGKLGDKERTFKLSFESIVNIENRTGKSVIVLTTDMAQAKYSFKDLIIILHEGLLAMGNKIVQEAVGDMVMKTGIVGASELAGNLLATAFTGETKEETDPLVKAENNQTTTQSKNT